MEFFLRWGMNESRIKLLCMTVLSYYIWWQHVLRQQSTTVQMLEQYDHQFTGPHPLLTTIMLTIHLSRMNRRLVSHVKSTKKKKLHKKHKSDVCLSSSFCPSWFLINFTRHPHFFLDDDEAAAIIPPATSPTSPKAPVMIAMPIIPSASNTNQVMLAQIRRTINSAKI